MAKRKSRYFTMTVYPHGIKWWLLVGWWWRPIQYLFWGFMCGLFNCGLKQRTMKRVIQKKK